MEGKLILRKDDLISQETEIVKKHKFNEEELSENFKIIESEN